MIGTDALTDIIKLTLQTGYIADLECPVNLLIIAKPESGKTSAMAQFKIKGTYTTNNITQWVIVNKLLPMIEREGLKHLIIPDFLNAIEKDYTTRKGFLNLAKTLIEEGITSLDQYNVRTPRVYDPPIQCGMITGITTTSFHGYYDKKEMKYKGGVKYEWINTGLLSRFVPFSYEYELMKIGRIFSAIEANEKGLDQYGKQIIRKTKTKIKVEGYSVLFQKLESVSRMIGEETGSYGFRMQRNLQALAKANAVLNGRSKVAREDIDKVTSLANWMNYRNNPL